MRRTVLAAFAVVVLAACGDDLADADGSGPGGSGGAGATSGPGATGVSTGATGGLPLGEPVDGEYNLGPVEWEGSFWNACAPYPPEVATLEGTLLAGLANEYAADGSLCDACIQVTTALGHQVIARVVTYGVTTAPGNIDVSQAAYDLLTEGEYPRTMQWQLVACPDTGPLRYQWQTGANEYWTSLWVRNPRVAIDRVEVQSANHETFTALERAPDGTFTDPSGFGAGAFTLRVVGIDGSTWEETRDGFVPGALDVGTGNL